MFISHLYAVVTRHLSLKLLQRMALFVFLCFYTLLSAFLAPYFQEGVKVAKVTSPSITEISGLCASRHLPDVLYLHNDSGDKNRIYAINSTNGEQLAEITIVHASANDWEDIACGPCYGKTSKMCVYVADTGGNTGTASNTIYRIEEPTQLLSHITVELDSKLQFSWKENDCETIMVDPNGETYLVSKVYGGRGRLVKLPGSAWGSTQRIELSESVPINLNSTKVDPVGGDISPDGTEVLIKQQGHVNYFYVPDGDYLSHMTTTPTQLPYHHERQGEAIAWQNNGQGYFTLSEGINQTLYYYERINWLKTAD